MVHRLPPRRVAPVAWGERLERERGQGKKQQKGGGFTNTVREGAPTTASNIVHQELVAGKSVGRCDNDKMPPFPPSSSCDADRHVSNNCWHTHGRSSSRVCERKRQATTYRLPSQWPTRSW